ncbi:hypothetical protein ACK39T_20350, partial [Aeromonas veronii]
LSISFNTPDCLIVTIGTVCENQDTSATIVIDFSGISRIERNPEKDKAAIFIFGHFSALQPA